MAGKYENLNDVGLTPEQEAKLANVPADTNSELSERQAIGTVWTLPPELSIDESDNTKFNISAGIGVIYNYDNGTPTRTIVTYTGATNVTPNFLLTHPSSNILIDSTGAIVQQSSLPTPEQRRDNLYIGALIHTNLTNLNGVQNEPIVDYDDSQTLRDLAQAIGIINYTGNEFSANGANLNIDKSLGSFFRIFANNDDNSKNPNFEQSAALSKASFLRGYYNGTSWVYDTTPTTTIPVTQYNNPATGLVAVSPNKFQIHNIYVFPGTNNVILHYGQTQYDTIQAALDGLSDTTIQDPQLVDASLRCKLIVKANATDLSDTTQAKFVPTGKFGQVVADGNSIPTINDTDVNITPSYSGNLSAATNQKDVNDIVDALTASNISDFDTEVASNTTVAGKADKTNVLELDNTTAFTPDADYEPTTKKYVDDSIPDISGKADKTNVLELDNTTPFTPDADYEPATKKYVDDNSSTITAETSNSATQLGLNPDVEDGSIGIGKDITAYSGSVVVGNGGEGDAAGASAVGNSTGALYPYSTAIGNNSFTTWENEFTHTGSRGQNKSNTGWITLKEKEYTVISTGYIYKPTFNT